MWTLTPLLHDPDEHTLCIAVEQCLSGGVLVGLRQQMVHPSRHLPLASGLRLSSAVAKHLEPIH